MSDVWASREAELIRGHYGETKAKRSGMPKMNHIIEGVAILDAIAAPDVAKLAFMLHPIVQADDDIARNWCYLKDCHPGALILAVEYRSVANDYLSYRKIDSVDEIRLSPVVEVQQMLVADKVQNFKDFVCNHGDHPRYVELSTYFRNWFEKLAPWLRGHTILDLMQVAIDATKVSEGADHA